MKEEEVTRLLAQPVTAGPLIGDAQENSDGRILWNYNGNSGLLGGPELRLTFVESKLTEVAASVTSVQNSSLMTFFNRKPVRVLQVGIRGHYETPEFSEWFNCRR